VIDVITHEITSLMSDYVNLHTHARFFLISRSCRIQEVMRECSEIDGAYFYITDAK